MTRLDPLPPVHILPDHYAATRHGLRPTRTPWGNTLMQRQNGALYLLMVVGYEYPAGLTRCDLDRAAALGFLLEVIP